ncbi:MAG: LacI family DNA-binding transcriptional regulator, partial [Pseudomonadota bacterium]|nr:LacI family DNA-binding transcriptional regulator [Pseudomonadota bacterium]
MTSIDGAARAGVSQSTVSRALSGSETIPEATRRRVERAAEELGYQV